MSSHPLPVPDRSAPGGTSPRASRRLFAAGETVRPADALPGLPRGFVVAVRCRAGRCALGTYGLEAGQIALLPAAETIVIDAPSELSFIGMDGAAVRDRIGRLEPLYGVPVGLPRGLGPLFDGLAAAIAASSGEVRPALHALDAAIREIILALIETLPRPSANTSHARLLLARARTITTARLGDPDFGPAELADALGVSDRYLRALFASEGDSASRFIAECRLDRSRRMVADPAQRHRALADIARANGFVSQSHFSRAFRARFGVSPSASRPARTVIPQGARASLPPSPQPE